MRISDWSSDVCSSDLPFLRYNLRSLYPYAHQIIVAEGAAPGARNIATPQGHSRDGTLEVLRRFKQEEDPEDKVVIVTAEDEGHPDGFWPGEKDEQSRAYAKRGDRITHYQIGRASCRERGWQYG